MNRLSPPPFVWRLMAVGVVLAATLGFSSLHLRAEPTRLRLDQDAPLRAWASRAAPRA